MFVKIPPRRGKLFHALCNVTGNCDLDISRIKNFLRLDENQQFHIEMNFTTSPPFLFLNFFCSVSLSVSLCLSYVGVVDASGFFVRDYRLREIYSLKRFSHPPSKDTERFYAEREM